MPYNSSYMKRKSRPQTLSQRLENATWFYIYCLSSAFAYPLFWWFYLKTLGLHRASRHSKIGTVTVVDTNGKTRATFGRVTTEALTLLKTKDPRRYRRIQNELRFIQNQGGTGIGSYTHVGRRCRIHFSLFPFDWSDPAHPHYRFYLYYYATILVHEATHGLLYSRGILYTVHSCARIERLCVEESHRFAVRLCQGDTAIADRLVPPFDPRQWRKYWSGQFGELPTPIRPKRET